MKKLLFCFSLFALILVSCTPTYMVLFTSGEGGSVSTPGGEYDEGTIISVTAHPDTEYEFERWSDGSTQNPRTITITQAIVLNASFVKKQYELTVNVQGEGTVQQDILVQGSKLNSGSQVQLTALPATGWYFESWTGSAAGNANPLNVDINSSKTITAVFKRVKFDLTVTVEGEGTVTEQIVVQPGQYDYETQVELTATPAEGWEFVNWTGDIGSSDNPITITVNTTKNITANFSKLEVVAIEVLNPISELIVSKKYIPEVVVKLIDGSTIDVSDKFKLDFTNSNISFQDRVIIGASKGQTQLVFSFEDVSTSLSLYVNNIEFETLDTKYLENKESIIKVPFLMINLFPTTDGIIHNDSIGPSSYWSIDNPSLDSTKEKIKNILLITKNAIEVGSSFRDYGKNEEIQYIQLLPKAYINVYVNNTISYRTRQMWFGSKTLDYNTLFEDLNIQHYVEDEGVKEVWITEFPYGEYPSLVNANIYDSSNNNWLPESNMSSLLTGDISNSYRIQNDLPIYSKSYVVYGNSGHRGVDTNLHNRGHQIESMLSYLEKNKIPNEELFWNKFVGIGASGNGSIDWSKQALNGRVGNTHYPPNGRADYDYDNQEYIESDISNWSPQGGEKISINSSTWKNSNFEFTYNKYSNAGIGGINNDPHTKWLIYWFQSIPGYQNNIPYIKDGTEYTLTNWWDLIYNWDEAIQQGKTLWE